MAGGAVRSPALGAILAQGTQAGISFVLQVLVARVLGVEELGRFAILYGVIVVLTGVVTGVVGDSLVVLDRQHPPIRSALQGVAVTLAVTGALVSGAVLAAIGLITPVEAVLFATAAVLFTLEEVLRRLLMADFAFLRVVAADASGFALALAIVLLAMATGAVDLAWFLAAIAAGQALAILGAVLLLPRPERSLARPQRGGLAAVLDYGTWRGLQQLLRPGMLTAVRLAIGGFAGLAAVGLLEAARVYVAPALLIVGGLTSYLFVRYAKDRTLPYRAVLRRADRTVLALVAATIVLGSAALAVLPWLGPLLFAVTPEFWAVVGWLAFTVAVAATTPYGTLAAVHGGQRRVFAIRLTDTVVSIAAVAALLATGQPPLWAPLVLAVGALLGGLTIRVLILAPLRHERADAAVDAAEQPLDDLGDGTDDGRADRARRAEARVDG